MNILFYLLCFVVIQCILILAFIYNPFVFAATTLLYIGSDKAQLLLTRGMRFSSTHVGLRISGVGEGIVHPQVHGSDVISMPLVQVLDDLPRQHDL